MGHGYFGIGFSPEPSPRGHSQGSKLCSSGIPSSREAPGGFNPSRLNPGGSCGHPDLGAALPSHHPLSPKIPHFSWRGFPVALGGFCCAPGGCNPSPPLSKHSLLEFQPGIPGSSSRIPALGLAGQEMGHFPAGVATARGQRAGGRCPLPPPLLCRKGGIQVPQGMISVSVGNFGLRKPLGRGLGVDKRVRSEKWGRRQGLCGRAGGSGWGLGFILNPQSLSQLGDVPWVGAWVTFLSSGGAGVTGVTGDCHPGTAWHSQGRIRTPQKHPQHSGNLEFHRDG